MDYMDRFGVWGFGVACGEVLVNDCPKHKGGGVKVVWSSGQEPCAHVDLSLSPGLQTLQTLYIYIYIFIYLFIYLYIYIHIHIHILYSL